jgi:putative RNA 2'-phosphotransferase
VTKEDLDQLVKENNKQRYSYNQSGTHIRANQGHSVEVDLQLTPETPPDILYHGTVHNDYQSIKETGIKKMLRHAVHLSEDEKTAEIVGSRRGKSVILIVDSKKMNEDGYTFFCSENGVWLTEHVPTEYVRIKL